MASGKNIKKSIRAKKLLDKSVSKTARKSLAKSGSRAKQTGTTVKAKQSSKSKLTTKLRTRARSERTQLSAAKNLAIEAVKKPLQKSLEGLTKTSSFKMVDDLLLRLSPNVQTQLDKISHMVETNTLAVNELKTIGFKVLQKAMEVSTSLRDSGAFVSRRKTPATKR